jgi:hypothetical protein
MSQLTTAATLVFTYRTVDLPEPWLGSASQRVDSRQRRRLLVRFERFRQAPFVFTDIASIAGSAVAAVLHGRVGAAAFRTNGGNGGRRLRHRYLELHEQEFSHRAAGSVRLAGRPPFAGRHAPAHHMSVVVMLEGEVQPAEEPSHGVENPHAPICFCVADTLASWTPRRNGVLDAKRQFLANTIARDDS